jgi:hypothetical protein
MDLIRLMFQFCDVCDGILEIGSICDNFPEVSYYMTTKQKEIFCELQAKC